VVRPEQITGSYELCMLIDGVVKFNYYYYYYYYYYWFAFLPISEG